MKKNTILKEVRQFQKIAGLLKESSLKEAVDFSGDINNIDFEGPEKEEAMAYLKTPEGMNAVNILKNLASSPFDAGDLEEAIKKCKFKKTNYFRVACAKAGLDLEGLGTVDNSGNGDFELDNPNYTDPGAAITFFSNKFYSVG